MHIGQRTLSTVFRTSLVRTFCRVTPSPSRDACVQEETGMFVALSFCVDKESQQWFGAVVDSMFSNNSVENRSNAYDGYAIPNYNYD
jgi:hypothetical protein